MSTVELDIRSYCVAKAKGAKAAARKLATFTGEERNRALRTLATLLRSEAEAIIAANGMDIAAAPGFGLNTSQIDRLRLTNQRIQEMAVAVEEIAAMPDPIGRVIKGEIRPSGLELRKVTVPLGVIFFIYESRPNVTTDAAALCLKSGNGVILRGGKEARHSNQIVGQIIEKALTAHQLPTDAVTVVDIPHREAVGEFLKLDQFIDVAIPRGGEGLIRRVAEEATMPVIKHFQGICHVYVHAEADVEKAVTITENSKCQRPSTCNAAETLLIDADGAEKNLPAIAKRLLERKVELRGCPKTCELVPQAKPASPDDYHTEYGELVMSVRVVNGLEEAIEHIAEHSSGHTETIVTEDFSAAQRFLREVDSSAVMVNASTRLNDGGQFGLGAEIGISTDKFHARGPCGLEELTSYKWVVLGNGHLRT
jgi:glutamate-5-semialdehyde dehydrogenase